MFWEPYNLVWDGLCFFAYLQNIGSALCTKAFSIMALCEVLNTNREGKYWETLPDLHYYKQTNNYKMFTIGNDCYYGEIKRFLSLLPSYCDGVCVSVVVVVLQSIPTRLWPSTPSITMDASHHVCSAVLCFSGYQRRENWMQLNC